MVLLTHLRRSDRRSLPTVIASADSCCRSLIRDGYIALRKLSGYGVKYNAESGPPECKVPFMSNSVYVYDPIA